MQLQVKLTSDIKDLGLLTPAQMRVATQAAISRTITTGKALIARRIAEEARLKIGDIKKAIESRRGSFASDPVGYITVSRDKTVWLSQFLTSAQKRSKLEQVSKGLFREIRPRGGIRVSVRRRATPKYPTTEIHPHAFLAVTPHSLHLGIFERTGLKAIMKSGRYKGRLREVIRRKQGPSPFGIFKHAKGEAAATIMLEIQKKLSDVFAKNMASQVQRFLNPRSSARQQQLLDAAEKVIGA